MSSSLSLVTTFQIPLACHTNTLWSRFWPFHRTFQWQMHVDDPCQPLARTQASVSFLSSVLSLHVRLCQVLPSAVSSRDASSCQPPIETRVSFVFVFRVAGRLRHHTSDELLSLRSFSDKVAVEQRLHVVGWVCPGVAAHRRRSPEEHIRLWHETWTRAQMRRHAALDPACS